MAKLPNMLFLMSDQHSPRVARCYGDPYVQTPTLDRFAAEGIVFDAAYCDNPLCVPSRMSMLTARHGHQLRIWTNDDSLDSGTPTLAHGLAIAGYRTVLVGRMHFVGGDQHHGFEEHRVGDVTSQYVAMNRAEHRFRGFYGQESLKNSGVGNSYDLAYDTMVAMEACRVIRDHEVSGDPRPLFLMVSFYSPHDPYIMPADRLTPYLDCDDDPVDPEPEAPPSFTRERLRKSAQYAKLDRGTRQKARAAYRAKTQFVDELLGRVWEAWRESPFNDDTVTIYTSDHGDLQGEHGLWAKGSFYEASARVPLILHAPKRLGCGRRVPNPVGLIDLGPTLLDIAQAPPLPNAVGASFLPALNGDERAWPNAVFAEQGGTTPSRMVRHEHLKYIHYLDHDDELYDLEQDPDEMQNLADSPEHAATCQRLRTVLSADGWHPEHVRAILDRRKPERQYLYKYARALEPVDPWQWGLAAQL